MVKIKPYLDEIRDGLSYDPSIQQKVISDLKTGIHTFLDDNPNATINDIYETFGRPDEIIENNKEKIVKPEYDKSIKKKRYIIVALIILGVLLLVAIGVIFANEFSSNHGHIVVGDAYEVTGVTPPNSTKN